MIQVSNLTKEFKIPTKQPSIWGSFQGLLHNTTLTKRVVNNINFTIEDGESVAYIGPNGAGKSTTIKMLTGILKPTSGNILVDGIDPQKERIKNAKHIGVVFGQRTSLWWDIPVEESFLLLKNIYEISDSIYQKNMDLFQLYFGLEEFIQRPPRTLSLGQRMRADLAAALLHSPSTLFLDEPTIGLDVETKDNMRTLIKKINQEHGVTIVLTSHDLKDIEDICKRIIIIDNGDIICDKSIEQLFQEYSMEREIQITLKKSKNMCLDKLQKLPGITQLSLLDNFIVEIVFTQSQYTAFDLVCQVNQIIPIKDFQIKEPDIKRLIQRILSIHKNNER